MSALTGLSIARFVKPALGHDGVLVHYTMDNINGGTVIDERGNHPGNIVGSARQGAGKIGLSFDFNGSTRIDLGNPPALQLLGSMSIAMWLYPVSRGFTDRQNPYNKAYGGEGTITLETDGILNYYYGTSGTNGSPYQGVGSVTTLTNNQWSHCVVVRDLEAMKLHWYINNVLTASADADFAAASASSSNLILGDGYTDNFTGKLDQFRLYNRALSAADVATLYAEGSA